MKISFHHVLTAQNHDHGIWVGIPRNPLAHLSYTNTLYEVSVPRQSARIIFSTYSRKIDMFFGANI